MSDTLFIPVLEGTTRKDRKSIHVARLLVKILQEQYPSVTTELVDPVDFPFHYNGNDEINKIPRYTEITKKADAFLIVVPEYNHSFPGSLKKLFDSELGNYNHKAVGFAGVSSGQFGGVRGIEAFNTVIREGGLVSAAIDIQFPKVQELFDEAGNLLDEAYIRRSKRVIDEVIWLAKAMKWGREHLNSS